MEHFWLCKSSMKQFVRLQMHLQYPHCPWQSWKAISRTLWLKPQAEIVFLQLSGQGQTLCVIEQANVQQGCVCWCMAANPKYSLRILCALQITMYWVSACAEQMAWARLTPLYFNSRLCCHKMSLFLQLSAFTEVYIRQEFATKIQFRQASPHNWPGCG